MPMNDTEVTVKPENIVHVGNFPLRLDFSPDGIRQHFDDSDVVGEMTDEQLAEIGYATLNDGLLYETFDEVLRRAFQTCGHRDPE